MTDPSEFNRKSRFQNIRNAVIDLAHQNNITVAAYDLHVGSDDYKYVAEIEVDVSRANEKEVERFESSVRRVLEDRLTEIDLLYKVESFNLKKRGTPKAGGGSFWSKLFG